MTFPVIEVERIGKCYQVGELYRPDAIRDFIISKTKSLFSSDDSSFEANELWALRDVSFQVNQGEVVGVVGRNGAGKSTLLKILSRITEPSEGRAKLRGRVASLLEVGTGFHRDLTGRENVYLSGAILGMKRHEIRKRFDEIVTFAEVERYIDTPVKRFSSGMQLRLAFSVAAHLEAEILLVDEVLAVGDVFFQRKCADRLEEIRSDKGKTIFFVSHNLTSILSVCPRALLLTNGELVADGEVELIVNQYLEQNKARKVSEVDLSGTVPRGGAGAMARLVHVSLDDADGRRKTQFGMGEALNVNLDYEIVGNINMPEVCLTLSTVQGARIARMVSTWEGLLESVSPGQVRFTVNIASLPLFPGDYTLGVWIKRRNDRAVDDTVDHILDFEVVASSNYSRDPQFGRFCSEGNIYLPSSWSLTRLN